MNWENNVSHDHDNPLSYFEVVLINYFSTQTFLLYFSCVQVLEPGRESSPEFQGNINNCVVSAKCMA